MSKEAMQAFESRRSKIIKEYEKHKPRNTLYNNEESDKMSNFNSKEKNKKAKDYEYDNPTFLNDNDEQL